MLAQGEPNVIGSGDELSIVTVAVVLCALASLLQVVQIDATRSVSEYVIVMVSPLPTWPSVPAPLPSRTLVGTGLAPSVGGVAANDAWLPAGVRIPVGLA